MAFQSSWQRYQAAWRDWQAQGGTGKPPQAVRDYLRSQTDARIAESQAKGYGPARFDNLNKQMDRDFKKLQRDIAGNMKASEASERKKNPTISEIRNAAAAGQTLYASTPSDCFVEVSWTDGVCSVTFRHKTQGTWDVPMSLSDFLDFARAPSLGQYFNAELYGA